MRDQITEKLGFSREIGYMLQYQFFARIDEDSDISEGTIFRVSTLYKLYSVELSKDYSATILRQVRNVNQQMGIRVISVTCNDCLRK